MCYVSCTYNQFNITLLRDIWGNEFYLIGYFIPEIWIDHYSIHRPNIRFKNVYNKVIGESYTLRELTVNGSILLIASKPNK